MCEVAGAGFGLITCADEFCPQIVERCSLATDKLEGSSVLCQLTGDGKTDTASGAGNDSELVAQIAGRAWCHAGLFAVYYGEVLVCRKVRGYILALSIDVERAA